MASVEGVKTGAPKPVPYGYWTRERIAGAIHLWVREHNGRLPTTLDWRRAGDKHPTANTVVARYGRWNLAIKAAGYKPRTQGRRPLEREDV